MFRFADSDVNQAQLFTVVAHVLDGSRREALRIVIGDGSVEEALGLIGEEERTHINAIADDNAADNLGRLVVSRQKLNAALLIARVERLHANADIARMDEIAAANNGGGEIDQQGGGRKVAKFGRNRVELIELDGRRVAVVEEEHIVIAVRILIDDSSSVVDGVKRRRHKIAHFGRVRTHRLVFADERVQAFTQIIHRRHDFLVDNGHALQRVDPGDCSVEPNTALRFLGRPNGDNLAFLARRFLRSFRWIERNRIGLLRRREEKAK